MYFPLLVSDEDLIVDEATLSQVEAEAAIDGLKIEAWSREDGTLRIGLAGPLAHGAIGYDHNSSFSIDAIEQALARRRQARTRIEAELGDDDLSESTPL